MRGVNKVILVGNLGRDPEIRYLPSGGAVTNITVACNDSYRDKSGEIVDATEFLRVVFYGKLAEIAGEYLKKGSKVYVEGSIHTRKWQDKQTGQDRYSTEIKANTMQMLDSRPDNSQSHAPQQPQRPQPNAYADARGGQQARGGFGQQQRPVQPHPNDDFDDIPF